VGAYYGWGRGGGVGNGLSGGVDLFGSDALTICDLAGPFVNGSVGVGDGVSVAVGGFTGPSPHGRVNGFGGTFGGGFGGSGSALETSTTVNQLTGKCGC